MKSRHFRIIHTVKVISSQNKYKRHTGGFNFEKLFAHCIRRTLIPGVAFFGLFSRPDLYISAMESIKIIGIGDVAMQRNRIELSKHGNFIDPGINTIADGDIDQAIFSGKRNSRFRTLLGQRKKTRSLPPSHDDCQSIFQCLHFSSSSDPLSCLKHSR